MNDLTNLKFGRLTVISLCGKSKRNDNMWLCRCDCGNGKVVKAYNLTSGHTKSCGCLTKDIQREKMNNLRRTHGLSNTRLYEIYCLMKARCYNQNNEMYRYYGKKGVKICDEWLKDFMNFYNWSLSHGYSDELTIDRIDVNGNYEPINCRWVTMVVQANNKTNNRKYMLNGEWYTAPELSRMFGVNCKKLRYRLENGWDVKIAIKN